MSEIEEKFSAAQQRLVDEFKDELREVAKEVLSKVYTDVLNYAATDAHVNYDNYLRDEFRAYLTKEIASDYGHYSWAHGIRMELLKKHLEILQNKIISDLQEQVKSLEEHIEQLRRYR